MAFFDAQPDLEDSDDERREFAEYYLKDLRFLYKNSVGNDKKVCESQLTVFTTNYTFSEMEGAFS